jgi:hypothetical protein
MCIERYVRLVAGSLVLLSLVLAQLVSPWWLLLATFVGANLLQASLTKWCLLVSILRKVGVPECASAAALKSASTAS